MFKSILPSRRVPSGDFTVITNLMEDNASKENQPAHPQMPVSKNRTVTKGQTVEKEKKKRGDSKKSKDAPADIVVSPQAFDKLLDDLQIPASLRPKLYGMDASVKAAMLKSSQTMAITPVASEFSRPSTPQPEGPKGLRRVHSSESLSNTRQPTLAQLAAEEREILRYPSDLSAAPVSAHNSPYMSPQRKSSGHTRGHSFDSPTRKISKNQANLTASSSTLDLTTGQKVSKDKQVAKNLSPTKFCSVLTATSSLHLDVEDVKKLRLLLRNESASWSEEFLKLGGYSALLTRLNEVLEVEWREEQHDDQVLHELLRCFKALSTSSIGCFALRSSCPMPFAQLVSLLYSDKKPGEVATRQLIMELLLILFDLYPPSALPASSTHKPNSPLSSISRQREPWESQSSLITSNLITLPAPHKSFFSFIRTLLLTPAPPPAEQPNIPVSPHEFIESLHVPRIYKTYLQELSDVCRDYFWVFCHPNNTIWILSETNEDSVEKPRAPGGMTGGVEFEAMQYFTTHLKFINAVAKTAEVLNMPKEHELSAYRFHGDLFLSGLERVILISRKASTTYYPTLHLELARYIAFALRAGYELPYTVARLVGFPPIVLAKNPDKAAAAAATQNSGRGTPRQTGTPTKGHRPPNGAPALPSPKKVEPMRFD
ncbi:armadillo-type protein [Crepidotus variabilis]|uniref:Armadillo-type protein n=1 Tax=Crepidotus variabilis TaxID=179855 RepID=A0A9P6ENR8_9AGAR|nr:armadillo-type protein [Crepidotus variabilis]